MKTVHTKSNGRLIPEMLTLFFAAMLLVFGFAAGASAKGVDTDVVKPAEIQPGTYSVITATEPAPIAILQKEGAAYELKLASAGSGYTVTSGLSEDQALKSANEFLQKDSSVQKAEVTEIKGPDGAIIGYELTPVFMPLRYGSAGTAAEVTGTSYRMSGNRIFAYVTPDPLFQTEEMGGG